MNIYFVGCFIYTKTAIEVYLLKRRQYIFNFKDNKTDKSQAFVCFNYQLQIGSTRLSATNRSDISRTRCRQIVEQHQ